MRGSVVLNWRSWGWSPSHSVGEPSKSFLWGAVLNVISSFISSGDIDDIFIVGLMLSVLNAHTSCQQETSIFQFMLLLLQGDSLLTGSALNGCISICIIGLGWGQEPLWWRSPCTTLAGARWVTFMCSESENGLNSTPNSVTLLLSASRWRSYESYLMSWWWLWPAIFWPFEHESPPCHFHYCCGQPAYPSRV